MTESRSRSRKFRTTLAAAASSFFVYLATSFLCCLPTHAFRAPQLVCPPRGSLKYDHDGRTLISLKMKYSYALRNRLLSSSSPFSCEDSTQPRAQASVALGATEESSAEGRTINSLSPEAEREGSIPVRTDFHLGPSSIEHVVELPVLYY